MAHIFNADFECATLAEFSNTLTAGGGGVSASNDQARTGSYSQKSNLAIAADKAASYTNIIASHAELYFRFYYYLPTATYNTYGVNDLTRLLVIKDSGWNMLGYIDIKNDGGTIYLRYYYLAGTDTMTCPSRDAWHCVEFYHKRDAANGAWQWWVDGVDQGSGAGVNTGANNCYYIQFGVESSTGVTGAVYFDNLAVALNRIYELQGNIPQGNALRNRVESPQGWII